MLNVSHAVAVLGLFGMACAPNLFASTIPFSSSGTSGTINPSSLPWDLTADSHTISPLLRGVSVWGTPGLGNAYETWPGGVNPAIGFTITFTGLPVGVTIDEEADPHATSSNDFTRFHNAADAVIWIPTYTGGNTVTFNAPGGYIMPSGTQFYINIAFSGGAVNSVTFAGDFETTGSLPVGGVPEPSSLAVVALTLSATVLFARNRILSRR